MTTEPPPLSSYDGSDREPPDPVHLLVSDCEDMIDAVVYHLDFHPTESIVAVLLRRGRILLCARCDLDGEPRLRAQLATIAVEHGADGLYLLVFSNAWTADEAAEMADRFAIPWLPEATATLLVTDTTWQEVGLWDGPVRPRRTTVLAAEAVYAGLNPHRDRAAAVAAAAPPARARWEELRALAEQARTGPAAPTELADWVADWLMDRDGAGALTDERAVRLAVLACDPCQRDRVWLILQASTAESLVAAFAGLVAVAVDDTAVGPLCLLGMASWVAGYGALLVQCIERADALAPDDPMVATLRLLNDRALPPHVWEHVREGMVEGLS